MYRLAFFAFLACNTSADHNVPRKAREQYTDPQQSLPATITHFRPFTLAPRELSD